VPDSPPFPITFSEARVLLLLLERLSPREVARELGISLGTVRTHIKHLQSKSDTHSLAALVLWGRDDCADAVCEALSINSLWSRRAQRLLTVR
jgi:DNA-binding CsgD family transcriptional regulator